MGSLSYYLITVIILIFYANSNIIALYDSDTQAAKNTEAW